MSEKILFEVCCGSLEDVIAADKNGAHRVELNSSLFLGGLTPSLGTLLKSKEYTKIPIICMIRCRGAGFNYSSLDIETMLLDARILLEHGADGIAFGALNDDFTIDIETTRKFVELTHSYNKEFVYHRAIDCTNDVFKSIEDLISLKVDRVLTSGTFNKAMDGVEVLKDLNKYYDKQIEILVGGGVNSSNILELVKLTQCYQFHSSCKEWIIDKTTSNKNMSYSYGPHSSHYDYVDDKLVRNVVSLIT